MLSLVNLAPRAGSAYVNGEIKGCEMVSALPHHLSDYGMEGRGVQQEKNRKKQWSIMLYSYFSPPFFLCGLCL